MFITTKYVLRGRIGKIEASSELTTSYPDSQTAALSLLIGVILLAIVYILIGSFDIIPIFFALVITVAIVIAQPDILKRMETQSGIQYYCLALIATLLFSIEFCKSDKQLVVEIVVAAGVMMISLYVGSRIILYLSVFLNVHVLARIVTTLINKDSVSGDG